MNSRIREIVIGHVGEHAALIAELEAYHERAMVEAADGALMGRAMLDRALDVRPGSKSPGGAVSDYVAGMMDDLRLRTARSNAHAEAGLAQAFDGVTDIIERNAPAWQGGESDDERARR